MRSIFVVFPHELNDDWACDTMHNPRFPLELFMRVVTVSLETQKIVRRLPPLDI